MPPRPRLPWQSIRSSIHPTTSSTSTSTSSSTSPGLTNPIILARLARPRTQTPPHAPNTLRKYNTSQITSNAKKRRTGIVALTIGGLIGVTYLLSNPIALEAPSTSLNSGSKSSKSSSKSSKSKGKSTPENIASLTDQPNSSSKSKSGSNVDEDEDEGRPHADDSHALIHGPDSSKKDGHAPGEEVSTTTQPSGQTLISAEEVAKHDRQEDCWVIIGGNVYDVTDFLEYHPGGAGVILNKAGQDATSIFMPLHPPNTLSEHLPPTAHLGPVDPTTLPDPADTPEDPDEARVREARANMPPIESILNLQDIEDLAEKVLSRTGWAYYRSASDLEDSYRNNEESWKRYYFRPRVLRDARHTDLSSTMLDHHVSLPVYIAPAAMAKLGHPLGEVNLTRGAGECGIVQGISSNASCSLEEMVEARVQGQSLIFQLYLNKDRAASERLLAKIDRLGCNGIMFTVDAASRSKRTLDQRTKGASAPAPPSAKAQQSGGQKPSKAAGISQAISGYQDDNLVWDDINFIKKNTKLPILIKGIQCLEDAEIAAEHGVAGVILSNHGGRQLNFSPASIDVLYEIRQKRPDLFDKMEIYVDGGVKSGTDVVKALALGAKGVGLGRAFLYANACYGQEGVEKVYQILHDEVTMAMAMIGAHKISDLKPEMVERAWWLGGQGPK